MSWIGITIGVIAVLSLIAAVVVRRRSSEPIDDVDPLFSTGTVLAGAGVALALTIGPVMYGMMAIGLIIMAVGAHRTRQHGHH